jgi:hypothetical protein
MTGAGFDGLAAGCDVGVAWGRGLERQPANNSPGALKASKTSIDFIEVQFLERC